jgi:uncharacterized protein (DUF2384 family)
MAEATQQPATLPDIIDLQVFGGGKTQTVEPAPIVLSQLMLNRMEGVYLRRLSERIPRQVLAMTMGVQTSNFAKLYNRRLTKTQTGELYDLAVFWATLQRFFGGDAELIDEWLDSPVPALGGARPKELVVTNTGRATLRQCLDAMAHGDMA